MFCPKCGVSLPDDAKFCTTCGYRMEETQPNMNAQITPDEMNTYFPQPGQAPTPRKKFNKTPLIVAALVVVAVLIAGTVTIFASPVAKNFVMKTFMSPEAYLGYVLENSADDFAAEIDKGVTILKNSAPTATAGTASVRIEKGAGLDQFVQDVDPYTYTQIQPYLNQFQSAGASGDVVLDDTGFSVGATMQLNDKDLISADVVMDMNNGKLYFGVPEVSATYLMTEMPGYSYGYSSEYQEMLNAYTTKMDEFYNAFPDEKTMEKLLKLYAKTATEQVDQVTKSSGTYVADGVSEKLTTLSVSVNEQMLYKISKAVVEEAANDKELKKIVEDFGALEMFGGDSIRAYNEFLSLIGEAQSSLNSVNEFELSYSQLVNLTFLVNNEGKLRGMTMYVDGGSIEYYTLKDGDNFATSFTVAPDYGQGFSIVGSGTDKGGKTNAVFNLKVENSNVVQFTVVDMDNDLAENGIFNGTFKVAPGSDVASLAGAMGSEAAMLANLELQLTSASTSKDETDINVALNYKNAMALEVKAQSKIDGNKSVVIPSNYINAEDQAAVAQWVQGADFSTVIANLRAAGFPEEVVVQMEEATLLMKESVGVVEAEEAVAEEAI